MAVLAYTHVDVFSSSPFSGNSLPVFTDAHGLSAEQMLRITQELRHFEAIFLGPTAQPDCVRARVFDLFGELPFAGHPIIGAAAVLHHASSHDDTRTWRFELSSRTVTLTTERTHTGFFGLLDQGAAEFFGIVNEREAFAHAFGLDQEGPARPSRRRSSSSARSCRITGWTPARQVLREVGRGGWNLFLS